MPSLLVLAGAVAALAALYKLIVFPLFLSPLAKIPAAHWSAPVSPVCILHARFAHRENRLLREAHNKHGPVVRVAPNALSVDGVDGLRTIYQGGFEKWKWYSEFSNYEMPNMFSTLGSREHSARKRTVSHVYSKSFIQSSEAAKAQAREIIFQRLLPLLKESASPDRKPHGIDVHSTFLAVTMDFISAYIYGIGNSTNFIQNKAYRGHWLELYLARTHHHFFPQELPRLTTFLKRIGIYLCPAWVYDANRELAEWNKAICDKTARSASREKALAPDAADEAVVFRAIHAGLDKEQAAHGAASVLYETAILHRDQSVASELFDHVTAGQETAGIALTYATWRLSQSPALQDRLRVELLTLRPAMALGGAVPESLPDPKQVDGLPLLHAVVMETLRLHAPIPGPQPRRTPYPACRLGPYTVPGGVRVASLAYTLHADECVFPRPAEWDPARWLPSEATEEERRERGRHFWAFGSGGRMCIGSNFAVNEMKLILAAIYTNFRTHIVDDEGMEQIDAYTSRPAGDRLFLRFEPVSQKA